MADEMISRQRHKPFFLWRHLNKLRWVTLGLVFAMLVLLPFDLCGGPCL
jgi:hypothetical protein